MKMIRIGIILFISLVVINLALGQSDVKWLTWEEVDHKMLNEPRKLLVSFQKSDCKWCDQLENETLNSDEIANYINEKFYAVHLDAFDKKVIEINGKSYKSGEQGVHELARALSRNQISFPMIVFVDENYGLIQPLPGIQTPEKVQDILVYFGENYYLEVPWKRFKSNQATEERIIIQSYFIRN